MENFVLVNSLKTIFDFLFIVPFNIALLLLSSLGPLSFILYIPVIYVLFGFNVHNLYGWFILAAHHSIFVCRLLMVNLRKVIVP